MRSLLLGRRPAMAAPSSSHNSISYSCLDHPRLVDTLLRSGEQSPSQRSFCSETPWSMAPDRDRDAFLKPCEQKGRSTLREHDGALSVIERLDECWFFGNVFNLPRSSDTSSSRSADVSPPLPAFRSIELVNPDLFLADFSEIGNSNSYKEFPRACFDLSPRCRETEDLNEEVWGSKPSANGIIKHESSSEQLLGTEKEILVADLRVEAIEADLQETEFVKELKQAEEKLEANPSFVKDQLNTTNLTGSKLDAVEQRKKVPIPLAPNNMNVGLSRKARRRRERKKKSRGTEHFEHDEMKGFKELGFSFSQDKLTPRVISLFPGMKVNYGEGNNDPKVSFVASPQYKLYASPAWWATKPDSPLYNWQFPDSHQEGVDMKAHLKFWARAVALTVRQES